MIFIRENIALIMIWVFALCISFTSYLAITNSYPSGMEFFLGHTLYAIPAMPNAFLHFIGFYDGNGAHTDLFFFGLAALYWAMLITVHYWHSTERELKYIFVIAVFVLGSSFKWLYFAVALIRMH